jgi:hypothetical protein
MEFELESKITNEDPVEKEESISFLTQRVGKQKNN